MPTPDSPASLPVRRLTLHDLPACTALAEDRGWPPETHQWTLLLTAGTGYGIDDPQGGLKAVCVLTSYGPQERPELGALGMLLVARRHARQGLGRSLLRQVILGAGPTPLALYATPQGQPLYEELGFKKTGAVETLRGRLGTRGASPGSDESLSGRTRLATASDLHAILALDTEVFGLDRTPLLARLPAFAGELRVAERAGGITGYAARWPGLNAEVLGPLLAQDTATAQDLLSDLAAGTERPLRTDVDLRHEELREWLRSHGMTPAALSPLMTRGLPELPGDWTRRFAPLTTAAV